MWRKSNFLGALLAAVCLLSVSGCGSSSSANVVTVTISSSVGNTIILGQSTTLTATVSGSTNLNVNWENQPCQYTTTTVSGTTSTTSKPIACPTDGSFGTLTNVQTTGTATYTAPTTIPDQTKFPGFAAHFHRPVLCRHRQDRHHNDHPDSGISVVL